MAFSAKKRESVISLQCHSKDIKLAFTARYGIDREEEMEVDSEPVAEIPHEVTLEVSDFRDASFSKSVHFKCSNIERNVIGKVGFLKDFVKSPEDFMKIITLISLHALGKDTKGPHLFPGEEVLFVRKDNIDGKAITYEKKRDLAGYMITLDECQQISNFVYQGNFQLMSVLWLLSEFVLTKFL